MPTVVWEGPGKDPVIQILIKVLPVTKEVGFPTEKS